MLNLTQKEKMLLEDQRMHEEHCIQKYANYANQAHDPQLRQIFYKHGQQEQQHLDTIIQILNGNVPMTNQQNNQGQQSQQQSQQNQSSQTSQQSQQSQGGQQSQTGIQNQVGLSQQASAQSPQYSINDQALCLDILMTEKYVSGAYDTAIFEFTDTNVRQALNHIQKEEQQHGEDVFHYMQSQGMYNPS